MYASVTETFSTTRTSDAFKLMPIPKRYYEGGVTYHTLAVDVDGSWSGSINLQRSSDGKAVDDVTKVWKTIATYSADVTLMCTSDVFDYRFDVTRSAGSATVRVL